LVLLNLYLARIWPTWCSGIFCENSLYLFTENTEHGPRLAPRSGAFLEDVYVIDLWDQGRNLPLQEPKMRKLSPEGKGPGTLKDTCMAEANGIIYIFGSPEEEADSSRSVLWTFNPSKIMRVIGMFND